MTIQRVAIVVVGDEILSGDTQETNAYYMAKALAGGGVALRRVAIIPDDLDVIAEQVAAFAAAYDVVITCGGIGPTHDDVTMEGIARAFDEALVEHPDLIGLMKKWRGDELDPSHRRLTRVPASTELVWLDNHFPLTRVHNVYVLPGVPRLLRQKFDQLLPTLRGEPMHQRQFHTAQDELALATPLEAVQNAHPAVSIGSYPHTVAPGEWAVRLVLKARDTAALDAACKDLLGRLEGLEELAEGAR